MTRHDLPRRITQSFERDRRLPVVLIQQQPLMEMIDHSIAGSPMEIAGHLLGFPIILANGLLGTYIERAVRASVQASRSHFVLNPETFDRINAECKETNTILVGYYHSHPSIGIFLSGIDTENIRTHYAANYNIAVVVDPSQKSRARGLGIGFFGWSKSKEIKRVPAENIIIIEYRPRELMPRSRISHRVEEAIMKRGCLLKIGARMWKRDTTGKS